MVRARYTIEQEAKTVSAEERLTLRRARLAPVLASLRERLLEWKEQLLPKHPMAEAISYIPGQWAELNVFCADGAAPIDNNASERELKRVVLSRKNSLFVGHPRGGRTAAMRASLTSTCRRYDMDPQRYLTKLLVNVPAVRQRELPDWLPDEWRRWQMPAAGRRACVAGASEGVGCGSRSALGSGERGKLLLSPFCGEAAPEELGA